MFSVDYYIAKSMMSFNDSVMNDVKEVIIKRRRSVGIIDLPDELCRLLQEFCSLKELFKVNRLLRHEGTCISL